MKFHLLVVVALVQLFSANGLKILGGFTEVWNQQSKIDYGRYFEWGLSATEQEGTEVILVHHGYCYNTFASFRGYCYQKLVVSTQNDPSAESYEIIDTNQVFTASPSHDAEDYGQQIIGSDETNITVASGEAWNREINDWGYAFTNYTVKKTARPSALDAISWQAYNSGSELNSEEEQFEGSKLPTSERVRVGHFRCYTRSWVEDSICYSYQWVSPTTLVKYAPRYSGREIIESSQFEEARPMVLENRGSGLCHIDLPRLVNTEQINTTSTARFVDAFDFDFDAPNTDEINFNAYRAGANVGFLTDFKFPSVSDMSNSVKDIQTTTVAWPSTCDPGFRVTYKVVEHSEKQSVPVDFKFERSGEQWTESVNAEVVLKWIAISANECCLFDFANPACGTDKLPMC